MAKEKYTVERPVRLSFYNFQFTSYNVDYGQPYREQAATYK